MMLLSLNEGSQSLYKSEIGRGTSEGWKEVQREVELEGVDPCKNLRSAPAFKVYHPQMTEWV